MTSTPFNVGLNDGTRLSSRVLRPPGGGHTDIFGGEPEPPRGRRMGPPQAASQIGQGDEPKPSNGTAAPAQNGQNHAEPTPAPQEPKQEVIIAPEPKQESPIKPEVQAESPVKPEPKVDSPTKPVAQEPIKVDPPKRVRVPPGGFSSGLW